MINVWIVELTPCLKDATTGEMISTEVLRVVRKSFLEKYNEKTGWYVDWASLLDTDEIYALVIKGTVDIQGLVAIERDDDSKAIYVSWMVAAPQNNKMLTENIKNLGVGGHLFAIAADKSVEYGYDGFLYGFAANKELLEHYMESFKADFIGMRHPYQFMIDVIGAKEIREVYVMSGLMQNYRESLANTPGPILLKDIPKMVIDYRGLIKYAREKGVQPAMLSEKEKQKFVLSK